MTSLFDNAVGSIRMGVEDFRQQDVHRNISAVRNVYAGILLLVKEAVVRAAPDADRASLIGARLRPVPDGAGGVNFEQKGRATIDFAQILERARDFDVRVDEQALRKLNNLRNDLEHYYSEASPDVVRQVLSDVLPMTTLLFRQLEEDPAHHLSDVWDFLLETKAVYDAERADALATLQAVDWHSGAFPPESLRCDNCGSQFVCQVDTENSNADWVELKCRSCKSDIELDDAIEAAFELSFGAEAYIRAKDGDPEGPLFECPACDRLCVHEADQVCGACGEEIDYDSSCSMCGEGISIQDFVDGLDGGLCSYCNYRMEKISRE